MWDNNGRKLQDQWGLKALGFHNPCQVGPPIRECEAGYQRTESLMCLSIRMY